MDVAVNPARLAENMDRPLLLAWWQRPLWRRLCIAGAVVLLVGVAVVVLLGPAQRSLRMARAGLIIATVEQGLYRDFIPLRGEAVPLDTVFMDTSEGGRVERVLVQAGDRVKAGQPMVEFSNATLAIEVRDRESNLVQSISSLQKLETQLELDRANNERLLADAEDEVTRLQRELGRREQLVVTHVISVEERDQYRDQLASAQRKRDLQQESNGRLEALRIQQQPQLREQIVALLDSLKVNRNKLHDLVARAPVAGLVTTLDLKVGESHARGDQLAEITPDTGFKLSASVDEYYLGRVREGQVGGVEREGEQWPLKVVRVYPQVKEGGFLVDLAFDGATPGRLLRGQSLQGRLSLGADQPGLVLASGAFLERSGGDWVFVLDAGGGTAQRRRVKLGRRNAEQVEVLDGLAAGEQVIVSDYAGLERIDRIDLKE